MKCTDPLAMATSTGLTDVIRAVGMEPGYAG